MISQIKTKED